MRSFGAAWRKRSTVSFRFIPFCCEYTSNDLETKRIRGIMCVNASNCASSLVERRCLATGYAEKNGFPSGSSRPGVEWPTVALGCVIYVAWGDDHVCVHHLLPWWVLMPVWRVSGRLARVASARSDPWSSHCVRCGELRCSPAFPCRSGFRSASTVGFIWPIIRPRRSPCRGWIRSRSTCPRSAGPSWGKARRAMSWVAATLARAPAAGPPHHGVQLSSVTEVFTSVAAATDRTLRWWAHHCFWPGGRRLLASSFCRFRSVGVRRAIRLSRRRANAPAELCRTPTSAEARARTGVRSSRPHRSSDCCS